LTTVLVTNQNSALAVKLLVIACGAILAQCLTYLWILPKFFNGYKTYFPLVLITCLSAATGIYLVALSLPGASWLYRTGVSLAAGISIAAVVLIGALFVILNLGGS
jgi:hypothetical protein